MAESAIKRFVRALAAPFQKLGDTIDTLILMRDARYATGVWLTQLGDFVGQPRQGVTDDDLYRRYVQARIITNKSDGQPETMYRIARVILGDTDHTLVIDNQGPATFVMRVGGLALTYPIAKIIIAFLKQAASGAVRVILEFSLLDEDETFGFEDSDGLGFLSFDELTGGGWACAIE